MIMGIKNTNGMLISPRSFCSTVWEITFCTQINALRLFYCSLTMLFNFFHSCKFVYVVSNSVSVFIFLGPRATYHVQYQILLYLCIYTKY